MTLNKKTLILASAGVVAAIVLGIGGYFLVGAMGEVHEENVGNLASFGSVVTPGASGIDGTTVGVEGQEQVLPSIGEEKLSASDKIIISLSKEKESLVKELAQRKRKISQLELELSELQRYKDTNERFAPRLLSEEKELAISEMQKYLSESEDAERFNDFQKEAMALDSANTYLFTLRQYQLIFDEDQKQTLISKHLPAYAFCIGDSIGVVANNRGEESRLLNYFRTEDSNSISPQLQEDLNSIRTPCLRTLNERINLLLNG
ncbi:MAG: hypothetical protein OQK12_10250 [Motiliproteus sp.]|nr:hypothetical protein [Motiliproteus sp.]MCW9053343.1 hypothetical protein [Motiliproteus sp.]